VLISEFEFNLDKRDRYLAHQAKIAAETAAAAAAAADAKGGGTKEI
jgi:hypothetical protein